MKCETNPLLFLHNEKCVAQCPPKWRPALFENECVEETEVPVIYFPLMIMTLLMAIIAYAGQYSSKLLDQRNHRKLISFYALTGVIDVLAMYFQVFCTVFQDREIWHVGIPLIALSGQWYLNYQYWRLWNVLDPPKPEDDNALTKAEVEAINECDQIFDQWNEKYAGAADFVKKVVMFGSHKFFYLPFTHFYGYLHFTVRVQETWKKWQWDSHDIARFRKNRGIDIRQLQKREENEHGKEVYSFKYKGKLVPELKVDILKQLTAAQLDTSNKRGGSFKGKGEPSEAAGEAAAGHEGGDVEYSGGEADEQKSSLKFWQSDKTFNPFDFV